MKRRPWLVCAAAASWGLAKSPVACAAQASPLNLLRQALAEKGREQGLEFTPFDEAGRLRTMRSPCAQPGPGSPQFSADGRHVYVAAASGWLGKFDLQHARWVAERQLEGPLADWALSADGQWLLVAFAAQPVAELFDAQLAPRKQWALAMRDGRRSSPAAQVVSSPTRRSFVLSMKSIAQLWEISYDPRAEDFYEGLVHDFRMGEGVPVRGFLNPRRIHLPQPLGPLWFDAEHTHAVGVAQGEGADPALLHIVNLDVRRRIATVALRGRPDLASACGLVCDGAPALAVPNLALPHIDVIDQSSWKLLRSVAAPAAGVLCAQGTQPSRWLDAVQG